LNIVDLGVEYLWTYVMGRWLEYKARKNDYGRDNSQQRLI